MFIVLCSNLGEFAIGRIKVVDLHSMLVNRVFEIDVWFSLNWSSDITKFLGSI